MRFSGDIVRNNIALRVFSDTSQMTSKCSKEEKTGKRSAGEWVTDVLTPSYYLPALGLKKKKCTFDEFRDSICRYSMFAVPSPTDQTTHPSLIPPYRGSRNKIKNLIFVPRSPDDVYPPLREEEQDDYLLNSLDMDLSSTSVIPPVSHVTKSRE